MPVTNRLGLGTLTRHLGMSPGMGTRWLILSRGILPASGGGWGVTREDVREGPGQRQFSSQQVLAPLLPSGHLLHLTLRPASLCLPTVQLAQSIHTEALGGGTGLGSPDGRTWRLGHTVQFYALYVVVWFLASSGHGCQPHHLLSPSSSHGSTRRDGGRSEGGMWRARMGPAGCASLSTPCA